VRMEWPAVSVSDVVTSPPAELPVRQSVRVAVKVRLGKLTPNDVAVQLLMGLLDATGEILPEAPVEMRATGSADDSGYVYEATDVPCVTSGAHGFTVRVVPRHPDMPAPSIPGLITWARA
jgi:starch phosphorylase